MSWPVSWSMERLLAGLFMLIALTLFGWYNMSKPRILILHSYDKDYAWVRDVNVGLARGLKNKYLYQLNWYYMDTKRHPELNFKTSAGIAARNVIKQARPDVLIAVDDDAQEYAARYFANDPNIKIVFAGINNEAADYGYDKANNVTGILERLPLAAISETLSSVGKFAQLGRPVRMAYLGDESATVLGDAHQVESFNWAPHEFIGATYVTDYSQWQQAIIELGKTVDIILVTGYRGLKRDATSNKLVPPAEIVDWTEHHSTVPVFSGNGFYTEDGGMLSIGTSPYEQGEIAAERALALALDGKAIADLPIVTSKEFIVTMSGSKMHERHFDLPRVYEAAARTGDKYLP